MVALCVHISAQVRKVRASQGRMPDNVWREQSQDQCNRKDTARMPSAGLAFFLEKVSVRQGSG